MTADRCLALEAINTTPRANSYLVIAYYRFREVCILVITLAGRDRALSVSAVSIVSRLGVPEFQLLFAYLRIVLRRSHSLLRWCPQFHGGRHSENSLLTTSWPHAKQELFQRGQWARASLRTRGRRGARPASFCQRSGAVKSIITLGARNGLAWR